MTDLVCAQAIFNHFNRGQVSTVSKIYAGAQAISRCADLPGSDNDKISIYLAAFNMEKEVLMKLEQTQEARQGPMSAMRAVAGPILLSAEENLVRVQHLAEKHHYATLKDEVDEELIGANSYADYLKNGDTSNEASE